MSEDTFETSDSWLEQEMIEGFRVWHVIAIGIGTAILFGTNWNYNELLCNIYYLFLQLFLVVVVVDSGFPGQNKKSKLIINEDIWPKSLKKNCI